MNKKKEIDPMSVLSASWRGLPKGVYGAVDYKIIFRGKEYTVTIDDGSQTVTPRNKIIERGMKTKKFAMIGCASSCDAEQNDRKWLKNLESYLMMLESLLEIKDKKLLRSYLELRSGEKLKDFLDE
ncbi:hypothetical protein FACS1894189_3780 [Planctomycetales bacterium]|nr:hypothetical protein FACS1894189_3780 [Planctomycetales bacterium]